MSKRKSLARLAVERSQSSQDSLEETIHKSCSNARPLSHHANADVTAGDSVHHQPLPPSTSNKGSLPPTVIRRRPVRGGTEHSANVISAPTHSNRHSYPATVKVPVHGQASLPCWQSPGGLLDQPAGSPPQKPPRASPQQVTSDSPRRSAELGPSAWGRPGAVPGDGRVQPSDTPYSASPPALSLSPPVDAGYPPAAENGLSCISPTASSGSSAGSSGRQTSLLTAHGMHHAHSTNDLQDRTTGRPAEGTLGPSWSSPMSAEHRARSFPSGLAGSVETLSSCSEPSAGSPLSGITVQKARSRGYLVNQTGSALLLSAEELDATLPQRQLHVLVGTWNMNAKEPPPSLDDLVLPHSVAFVPDLVVLGTQESHGDHRGLLVRLQATLGPSHVLFHSASLGTLHVCVFIRRDLMWYCSVPEEASYSIRQPTAIKTKGCVAIGFQFFGTTFLLLTCHLTAHLEKQNQRIDDVRRICAALDLPQAIPSRSDSRDVTERYDNVFWFGDLNFRLHQSRPRVIDTIVESSSSILLRERTMSEACMRSLLEWDQLNHAKHKGRAFEGFSEGDISFLPTYKYDPGTNTFDTSHKQRIPAYTDRILFKSRRDNVRCLRYDSVQPFNTSDHKPVWGLYQCQIRPSLDSIPLSAGQFHRGVFLEGLQRRARHLPARRGTDGRPCSVQ